jgi:hypothetical protein
MRFVAVCTPKRKDTYRPRSEILSGRPWVEELKWKVYGGSILQIKEVLQP